MALDSSSDPNWKHPYRSELSVKPLSATEAKELSRDVSNDLKIQSYNYWMRNIEPQILEAINNNEKEFDIKCEIKFFLYMINMARDLGYRVTNNHNNSFGISLRPSKPLVEEVCEVAGPPIGCILSIIIAMVIIVFLINS